MRQQTPPRTRLYCSREQPGNQGGRQMHLSIFDHGEFLEENVSDFEDRRLYFALKIAGFDFDLQVKTSQECIIKSHSMSSFHDVKEIIFKASTNQSLHLQYPPTIALFSLPAVLRWRPGDTLDKSPVYQRATWKKTNLQPHTLETRVWKEAGETWRTWKLLTERPLVRQQQWQRQCKYLMINSSVQVSKM